MRDFRQYPIQNYTRYCGFPQFFWYRFQEPGDYFWVLFAHLNVFYSTNPLRSQLKKIFLSRGIHPIIKCNAALSDGRYRLCLEDRTPGLSTKKLFLAKEKPQAADTIGTKVDVSQSSFLGGGRPIPSGATVVERWGLVVRPRGLAGRPRGRPRRSEEGGLFAAGRTRARRAALSSARTMSCLWTDPRPRDVFVNGVAGLSGPFLVRISFLSWIQPSYVLEIESHFGMCDEEVSCFLNYFDQHIFLQVQIQFKTRGELAKTQSVAWTC